MAILAFLILSLASAAVQRISATAPTLYAFGDSTTDVGNLLPEDNPNSIHSPYGIDYPGGTPTGRFSNGFLVVDYIAQVMGLPKSPPAFRAITNEVQTIRGVNFASSGSGILNTTGENVISLDEQIDDFNTVAANVTARVGAHLATIQFSLSLFYINAGSNDLIAQYIARRPVTGIQKDRIVALIVNKFRDQLKVLYKLGARKFAVVGTGLIGCAPVARVMLENLSSTQERFEYSFVDFYEYSNQIAANPSEYGFTEIKSACCGGGRLNSEVQCGAANTTYCGNRAEYLFWDGLHPTQALYKKLAHVAVTGSAPWVTPVNVLQLILTT